MFGNSQSNILSIDSNNKIEKYQCYNCNKSFSNKYSVSRHLKNNICKMDNSNLKLSVQDIQELIKENRMMKNEIDFVKEENKVIKEELEKAQDKLLYYENNLSNYQSSGNNTNCFNNINTMNVNNIHNLNIYFEDAIPIKTAVNYLKTE